MTEVTRKSPDELARRIQPIGDWLPTVLELSLVGFTTLAAVTAAEVVAFLAENPSPSQVLSYQASERSRERLERLLTLNSAGLLGESEQRELRELEQVDHIVVMLKAQARGLI